MSAASLSLLKGGKKEAVDAELEATKTAEPEPETTDEVEEEEVVDVDSMSSEELDDLVAENDIEVPDEWETWKAEEKRAWLKSQFDEAPEGEEVAEEPTKAPEPAPKPAAKAKEKASAKSKAKETAPAPEPEQLKEEPSTAVTTAEKPAKPKGKAVAKAAKSGEVQKKGDDALQDLIHEIETLQEPQAKGLVAELAEQTEVTFFRLGGVLSVIQANGWYSPYTSFREYVEKEHGIDYRRATYWVAIYNSLAESKVPWSKVAHLGWTKLKEIARVLTTDNVDEWVKIAESQNTISLIDTVKKYLASKNGKTASIEDQSSKTVTTKTFKVHEDQKKTIDAALEKARIDAGTDADTVALEYICGDYLSAQTLVQKLKGLGIEKALEALEKAYPSAKIEVEIGDEDAEAA